MAVLEIPFAYRAEYIAPRRRLPDTSYILDSVPIRVREVSVSDAPVAAVWRCRIDAICGPPGAAPPEPASRDAEVFYRVLGGRMMRPYCRGMVGPDSFSCDPRPMSPREAQDDMRAWTGRARSFETAPEWGITYDLRYNEYVGHAVARGELRERRRPS